MLGFAIGINSSIIPLYLKEISPLELSGFNGSLHPIFINIGLVMSYTLSLKLPELTDSNFLTSNWWRVMFAIPIIPAIIRIVSFLKFYKSDTPNYLVQNGREDEA